MLPQSAISDSKSDSGPVAGSFLGNGLPSAAYKQRGVMVEIGFVGGVFVISEVITKDLVDNYFWEQARCWHSFSFKRNRA